MNLQYILKISNFDDSVSLAQIINPQGFNFSKNINDINSGSFNLEYDDINATREIIKKWNRFDFYEQIGEDEILICEGVIDGYSGSNDNITVQLKSFEHYFQNRILLNAAYNPGVVQSVETVLTNTLNLINAEYSTGITLDLTDIPVVNTRKKYERGTDFLKILKDLSVVANAEFSIIDREIKFKSLIGIDRTIPGDPNFLEFRSDIINPAENSIQTFTLESGSGDFASAVLGKKDNSFSTQIDIPTQNEFGRIEFFDSFDSTDSTKLTEQTAGSLELKKKSVFFHRITPVTGNLLFSQIGIGDFIPIYINTGSDLVSADGVFKIVKIDYQLSDNSPIISIELSEEKVTSKDLIGKINQISDKVKDLLLRI